MIYVVGGALFVISFLLLITYIDWREEMDWWDEFEYKKDEDNKNEN